MIILSPQQKTKKAGWVVNEVYQENADEFSSAGPEVYFTYNKPENALSTSTWKVRHGNVPAYSITIPTQCWGEPEMQLKFKIMGIANNGHGGAESQPYCSDGSIWIPIGTHVVGSFYGLQGGTDGYSNANDGDWDSFTSYDWYFGLVFRNNQTDCYAWCYGDLTIARIYEEAMEWDISACVDDNWLPEINLSDYCVSEEFTQTSDCNNTRTVYGEIAETWDIDPATICAGVTFTQTSTCHNRTRELTGTKDCSTPPPSGGGGGGGGAGGSAAYMGQPQVMNDVTTEPAKDNKGIILGGIVTLIFILIIRRKP